MSTKINIYTTSGLFTLTAGDNDVEAVELVKNTYQIIMTKKRARKNPRDNTILSLVKKTT